MKYKTIVFSIHAASGLQHSNISCVIHGQSTPDGLGFTMEKAKEVLEEMKPERDEFIREFVKRLTNAKDA